MQGQMTGGLDHTLDKLSKQDLKELFKEAYKLLTKMNPREYKTDNITLKTLLLKVKDDVKLPAGKYKGEIVNGVPNGKGKATFNDGDTYNGEWINGKMEGVGVFKSVKNNASYSGEYRNDLFEGLGTYTHGSGEIFFGCYKAGGRHGPYQYTFKDGSIKFGVYENDKDHGPYLLVSPDKAETFFGQYVKGKEEGERRIYKLEKIQHFEMGDLVGEKTCSLI